MAEEDHKVENCEIYGEEIIDGICQKPRPYALICVNCRYNAHLEKVAQTEIQKAVSEAPAEKPIEDLEEGAEK